MVLFPLGKSLLTSVVGFDADGWLGTHIVVGVEAMKNGNTRIDVGSDG